MMNDKLKFCDCCGAKIVEYKHTFNKALATGLCKLYESGGGPINLKDLSLTRNQWDNFQKLRYWGLVRKYYREDGTRADGVWEITEKGLEFIFGISVTKSVWTYRGEPVRFEGDTCYFSDLHDPVYERRESYAINSIPHIEV